MTRLARFCLILTAAVTFTGCAAISPPKVSIASVELVGEAEDASSLVFHGTVENPHPETLRLLEYSYSVSMEGRSVYVGRHAAEMTLTPGAKRKIVLPAGFTDAAAGWKSDGPPQSSRWSMSGSLLFLGEGVLAETLLDMGIRPTVGFSASGELQRSTVEVSLEQ